MTKGANGYRYYSLLSCELRRLRCIYIWICTAFFYGRVFPAIRITIYVNDRPVYDHVARTNR